jgi:hypothetical protein
MMMTMIEKTIETSKPFLYKTVDFLYNGVMNHAPEVLQKRSMASAFLLGAIGIYGVVKGLQFTSKKVMNRIIPDFDEKWLPKLEKTCIAAMGAAPVIYFAIDPDGAQELLRNHPVYTSGMAGVYVGSITGAAQDLHKRKVERIKQENKFLADFSKNK